MPFKLVMALPLQSIFFTAAISVSLRILLSSVSNVFTTSRKFLSGKLNVSTATPSTILIKAAVTISLSALPIFSAQAVMFADSVSVNGSL